MTGRTETPFPARLRASWQAMNAIVRGAARHYGQPACALWPRALRRHLVDRFSLTELRAYAPFVGEVLRTLPVVVSKEASLARLARINPRALQWQTEDKEQFYGICRASGIAHPRVCAVLGGGRSTWLDDLPTHFITKERSGAYASGFAAFERIGSDQVRVDGGPPQDLKPVLERLAAGEASLVLQERLFDHPALGALSARPVLQNARITTLRDAGGRCRMLFWMLKIVIGENLTDNFSGGKSGNLIAFGNRDDGTLEGARTLHPAGVGLTTITSHPETRRPLAGYAVPLWREAVEAALEAHRHFPGFGALGWDVAITAAGPRILEANAWWDPPTYAPWIMSADDWRLVFARHA